MYCDTNVSKLLARWASDTYSWCLLPQPFVPACSMPFFFPFFFVEAATQLARQVHQERTQVVCSNKADWSRLALRHSLY